MSFTLSRSVVLGLVASLVFVRTADAQPAATPAAKTSATDVGDRPVEARQQPPSEIEAEALKLLVAGRQDEAERLVDADVMRNPQALELLKLLHGQQTAAAHEYAKANSAALKAVQPSLFLYAACKRSRFEKRLSYLAFYAVYCIDPESRQGKCADRVMQLDTLRSERGSRSDAEAEFARFELLLLAEPDDAVARWMMAVQCRTWDRDQEGAQHYGLLLEQWNPGPALLHQTYANLLDNLKRYDEALTERIKVVEMEPAGWSYDGLGNTLNHLKRYPEGHAAHAKAVELNPGNSQYLVNWACGLYDNQEYDEAIKKCRRATEIEPENMQAWRLWVEALKKQQKWPEALQVYKRSYAAFKSLNAK